MRIVLPYAIYVDGQFSSFQMPKKQVKKQTPTHFYEPLPFCLPLSRSCALDMYWYFRSLQHAVHSNLLLTSIFEPDPPPFIGMKFGSCQRDGAGGIITAGEIPTGSADSALPYPSISLIPQCRFELQTQVFSNPYQQLLVWFNRTAFNWLLKKLTYFVYSLSKQPYSK